MTGIRKEQFVDKLPKDLNIPSQTAGSILYFNGTNWVVLPPSIDGYFLQINNNVPSWKAEPPGFSVSGTPAIGKFVGFDGVKPIWTLSSGLLITGFNVVSTLVETGITIVNPTFTASYNSTPVTVTLTNNFDSESKDVSSTPNSFASSHSFLFATPNLTITFINTATLSGSPNATANASIISGQKTFGGIVTTGSSLATLIAGSTTNSLRTGRGFSFTVTGTGGTSRAQWAYPTRYGTPATVKDHSTGFGIAYNLIGTTSYTNAQGYSENYNQYETISSFTGALTLDIT